MLDIKTKMDMLKMKVDILKLKANDHDWSCYVPQDVKNELEGALSEINSFLSGTIVDQKSLITQLETSLAESELIISGYKQNKEIGDYRYTQRAYRIERGENP